MPSSDGSVPVTHFTYANKVQYQRVAAVQVGNTPVIYPPRGTMAEAMLPHPAYDELQYHCSTYIPPYNVQCNAANGLPSTRDGMEPQVVNGTWTQISEVHHGKGGSLQASPEIRKSTRKRRREVPERKGAWFPEEDSRLKALVGAYGPKQWREIARSIPGRTGKQARERWMNQLRPEVKKNMNWTSEEDELIISMQRRIGNQWSKIAKHLPGRTDNHVKNRFNSTLKKRILNYVGPSLLMPVPLQPVHPVSFASDRAEFGTRLGQQQSYRLPPLHHMQPSVPRQTSPIDPLRFPNVVQSRDMTPKDSSTMTSISSGGEAQDCAESSSSSQEPCKRISVRDLCC